VLIWPGAVSAEESPAKAIASRRAEAQHSFAAAAGGLGAGSLL